jgi:hypothetical protein
MSKLDGDVPMTLNDIQPVLPPAFLNAVAALHNLRVEEAALDRQARIVAVRRVRLEVLLMQCFYRWVMPIARQLARALVALVGPVQTRKLPGARTRKKRVTAIGSFEALAKAVGADALAFPPAYRPLVLATLEHLRFSAQRPATNRSSSPPPPIGILLAAPLAEPFGVDTTALGLHVVLPMPRDVRVQSDLTHDGFADAFAATFGRLWIAVFIRPQLASIPLEARQASSGGRALVDDAQLEVAPADQLITRVAFAIAIAQGLRTADVFYDATFLRAYKDGTARILLSSDKAASQTYPSLSHDILGSPVQHSETVRPLARGARALAEADEDVAIALADQAAVYDLFAGNRTPRTLRRRQAGPQVPLADEQAATPADGLLLLAAVLAPGLAVHVLGLAEDENPLARYAAVHRSCSAFALIKRPQADPRLQAGDQDEAGLQGRRRPLRRLPQHDPAHRRPPRAVAAHPQHLHRR